MPGSTKGERRLFLGMLGILVASLAVWGGIVLATDDGDGGDPVPLEVLAAQIATSTTGAAPSTTALTAPTTTTSATTSTSATTTSSTSTSSTSTTTTAPAPTTTRAPATTTTATVVIIPPITIETTTTSRVPIEPPIPPSTTTTVPETTTTVTTTTTLAPGIYVHDLSGDRAKLEEPLWTAEVQIQVRNEDGDRVAGATVAARWSNGEDVLTSGTTDDRGRVTLTLPTAAPAVTLAVVGVTHPDHVYRPDLNRKTSITIESPY